MTRRALLQIGGMTCSSCSSSIEEAVRSISGVETITVSLLTEQANVVYDDKMVDIKSIKSSVEDCGFDCKINSDKPEQVVLTKLILEVEGMSCGSCSASISAALEKLEGIKSVSISVLSCEAVIIYNKYIISESDIITSIQDCGFGAKAVSSKKNSTINSQLMVTRVSVKGMTCGGCSSSIVSSLEAIPEVIKASVSLLTEEAYVQHTPSISSDKIVDIIHDCGFESSCIESKFENKYRFASSTNPGISLEAEEEHVNFQIYGINDTVDIVGLEYNIEALLSSFPSVIDYNLSFQNRGDLGTALAQNSSNSNAIQAIRSREIAEVRPDVDNLIDEVSVTYDASILGIRELVTALNAVHEGVSFVIMNSVDSTSTAQLKLLSKVKDIIFWRRTFLMSLLFGFPVVALDYIENTNFARKLMILPGLFLVPLIEAIMSTYVVFWLGDVFLKKFLFYIKNGARNASMDVLVTISVMVSYIFSMGSMLICIIKREKGKSPNLLFGTGCMVLIFISLGKWLENRAKGATSSALSKLLTLTPTTCTIVEDEDAYMEFLKNAEGNESANLASIPTKMISIDLVQTGDIAVVLPGAKVPADGVIIHGSTEVDESIMTGEALPAFKSKGDQIVGGTINTSGIIHMKVTRTGKKSHLQQIINLVKESQIKKAPVQRFADYIATRFVPAVLIMSMVTFLSWCLICYFIDTTNLPAMFQKDTNGKYFVCLKFGISVIVVACPCALGLAAPTAVMVGTGVGAENGIFIKGGDILEKAQDIKVIMFDKTGTLTTGLMTVVSYNTKLDQSLNVRNWWSLVGGLESNSSHPVARAIAQHARSELQISFEEDTFDVIISDCETIIGSGMKANLSLLSSKKNYHLCIGNMRLIQNEYPDLVSEINEHITSTLKDSSNTIVHVVVNNSYTGYIELSDTVKPGTKELINYLRLEKNFEIGMITGDSKAPALKIAKEIGIPDCNTFYEVLPANKDKVIVDLHSRISDGSKSIGIAFVGDGINDAPALVQADIGMAISSGTDIAIESADIVLLDDGYHFSGLVGVPLSLKLSNDTFKRIKLNFFWAMLYNSIMLPFAMGFFIPFNIALPPAAAACAMAFSSLSVVTNSLLLKKWKPVKLKDIAMSYIQDLEKHNYLNLKTATYSDFIEFENRKSLLKGFSISSLFKRRRNNQNRYELLPTSY